MNACVRSLVVACIAGTCTAAEAQVYSATPGARVPTSGTLGTISSQLAVDGAPGVLSDVNVIVDITHTYAGDLDIILVPPSGDVYVHLSSDNGGLGDNYRFTRFDQQVAALITSGAAPFNGTYHPEGGDVAWRLEASVPLPGPSLASLEDLNGIDPNGTWIIIVDDDSLADSGQLEYWSLELNGAIDPLGPPVGTLPTGSGMAMPATIFNDGSEVATLTVDVTPGSDPASTFVAGSVIVDASAIGGEAITLLDDGVGVDQVAGDLTFSAVLSVPIDAVPGLYALPFVIQDDQFRAATGTISVGVLDAPPPCVPGLASATFRDVVGNGAVGDAGNDVRTVDFGVAGQVDQVTLSGRFQALPPSSRTEVQLRATAPDGSVYEIGPFTRLLPGPGVVEVSNLAIALPEYEDGSGEWTFEAWESFNDLGLSPDARWDRLCVSVDLVPTNPSATWTISPRDLRRDGITPSVATVRVVPGLFPVSDGISVIVDDSSIGGSGSVVLRDDGVAPDVVAGDNSFTGNIVATPSAALGPAEISFVVTDQQGRSVGDMTVVSVFEAFGACCVGDACTLAIVGDCINGLGGTFAGHLSVCSAAVPLTTDGAGAFEDISSLGNVLTFANTDDGSALLPLPFSFNYFGTPRTGVYVHTNGYLQFTGTVPFGGNGPIPDVSSPNNAIYALWDDLDLFTSGRVRYLVLGTPGVDLRVIVQWTNVGQYNNGLAPTDVSTFQVVLFEDSTFEVRYLSVSPESGASDTSTIGFEDSFGTVGYQLPETRATLAAQCPISFRGTGIPLSSGVCQAQPTCPECAADFDQDGGVTGADIGMFFEAFEQGLGCADVDGDGGVTGGDIGAFFAAFEAGGC